MTDLAEPIVVSDGDSPVLDGGNRKLTYSGPPTPGVIQLARCSMPEVLQRKIVVASSGVDAALLLTNLPGTSPVGRVSTEAMLEKVLVEHGGFSTAARRAISIDASALGGTDGNNDYHELRHAKAKSYSEVGIYVNGSQCHDLVFDQTDVSDDGRRYPVGIQFAQGVFATIRNGRGSFNRVDILTGGKATQLVVIGWNGEHSRQFLVADAVTGREGGPVHWNIQNVQWRGDPVVGTPIVDGWGPGPFFFRNCNLDGVNGVWPTMRFDGYSGKNGKKRGFLKLEGIVFRCHTDAGPPARLLQYPAGWEVRIEGCWLEAVRSNGSVDTFDFKG